MRLSTQVENKAFASYECANDREDFAWLESDYSSSDTENKNANTLHANDFVMTPNADLEGDIDDDNADFF